MTNKIIIDGWNVCWKIPGIASLIPKNMEKARNEFNTIVKNHYYGKKVTLKIIYDGQPGMVNFQKKSQSLDVQFSKNPEKADHMILNLLRKQQNTKQWTVITSDRQLSDKITGLNANVISSEQFIDKLKRYENSYHRNTMKENPRMDQNEIEYWLKLFKE